MDQPSQKTWIQKTKKPNCPASTVYKIAVPIMLSSATATLLTVVDTMMLGKYSAVSLASVGIMGSIVSLLSVVGSAMGVGLTSLISQSLGAKQFKQSGKHAKSGLIVGLFTGIITFWAIHFLAGPLLLFLGAENALHQQAMIYISIVQFIFLFMAMGTMFKSIISANAYTRPILYTTIIVNVTNVIINYALIYGHFGFPEMGVAGAAWATLFSAGLGFIVMAIIVFRKRVFLHLNHSVKLADIRYSFPKIARLATPTIIEWGIWMGSMFFVNKFIVGYGSMEVSLFHIGMKIQSVFMICLGGFSTSSLTLAGKAFGARDAGSLFQWNRVILKHTLWISLVGTVICILFPKVVLHFFLNVKDMANLPGGVRLTLSFIGILILLRSVNIITGASLRGIGDIAYFFKVQPIGMAIFLSLSWFFLIYFQMGASGVFAAMIVDELFRAILVLVAAFLNACSALSNSPLRIRFCPSSIQPCASILPQLLSCTLNMLQ